MRRVHCTCGRAPHQFLPDARRHAGRRDRDHHRGPAADGTLHVLQQAFIDHDAFQCGYCTSGQISSAVGLIAEGKAKTADEIRDLMSGNICRCGAYPNIVAAIQQAMGLS
jgi:xanthine dehydrogenase YagT iron-sulfur-binding subunit